MPRNPNKLKCQMPGCRSWSMRDHVHCRSHRDHELGPRHAGAPKGNYNAFKHGRYARRRSNDRLKQLAHDIIRDPDHFPRYIDEIVRDVHHHSPDTLVSLIFIRKMLTPLVHIVAEFSFAAELDAFLDELPPHKRPHANAYIWKSTVKLPPVERVSALRTIRGKYSKKVVGGKTIGRSEEE